MVWDDLHPHTHVEQKLRIFIKNCVRETWLIFGWNVFVIFEKFNEDIVRMNVLLPRKCRGGFLVSENHATPIECKKLKKIKNQILNHITILFQSKNQ